jgi:hypothetical protein
MQGITMRFLASTAVSTAPPVVLQFRLDWSFVPGTVVLVTTILPDHFLHVVVCVAPSGASSLEDASSRGLGPVGGLPEKFG